VRFLPPVGISSQERGDQRDLEPDEQATLLKQITEADEQKKMRYFILVPGRFYEIEYGLLKGGGKGGLIL